MEQQQFVGLDVSQAETAVCVVDDAGKVLWHGKCASTPEAMAAVIGRRAPYAVRIALETGPMSAWHWRSLSGLNLPVVCVDARHAKAALAMQVNKTDANDALGLAQIVRTGWYREVQVKSERSHRTRGLLTARAKLIDMRKEVANQLRGLLKVFGHVIGAVGGEKFAARARELAAGDETLSTTTDALLAARTALGEQIARLDKVLLAQARQDPACRRLMTVPSIGAITATAFVATIDDPARFKHSASVGAYLGLTPKRYQSGTMDISGPISKTGDALLRCYLFEAATTLLSRVQQHSTLRDWGIRLAKRIGQKKARVAVARKLAVILHRMWADQAEFSPVPATAGA
jgi:transposase